MNGKLYVPRTLTVVTKPKRR